ncbi:hypothetical protein HK104_000308, partial [Borealophlyctis nickersoniae]
MLGIWWLAILTRTGTPQNPIVFGVENPVYGGRIELMTGTAVYVRALPTPPSYESFPEFWKVLDEEDQELLEIQEKYHGAERSESGNYLRQ